MKTFYARNESEWREWLQHNYLTEQEVWLVFYRKGTGTSGVDFDKAVDTALCFGWIDSAIKKIDDVKYARRFTSRRIGSVWSESNIERAKELLEQGKMSERGAALFDQRTVKAPSAGLPFPPKFLTALKRKRRAWENFQSFSPSHKREYLNWITSAKRAETKDRRIKEAVAMIAKAKSLVK